MNVAEYYGVPLWSFRSTAWQQHLRHCNFEDNSVSADKIDCSASPFARSDNIHPLWYTHNTLNAYTKICHAQKYSLHASSSGSEARRLLYGSRSSSHSPQAPTRSPLASTQIATNTFYRRVTITQKSGCNESNVDGLYLGWEVVGMDVGSESGA